MWADGFATNDAGLRLSGRSFLRQRFPQRCQRENGHTLARLKSSACLGRCEQFEALVWQMQRWLPGRSTTGRVCKILLCKAPTYGTGAVLGGCEGGQPLWAVWGDMMWGVLGGCEGGQPLWAVWGWQCEAVLGVSEGEQPLWAVWGDMMRGVLGGCESGQPLRGVCGGRCEGCWGAARVGTPGDHAAEAPHPAARRTGCQPWGGLWAGVPQAEETEWAPWQPSPWSSRPGTMGRARLPCRAQRAWPLQQGFSWRASSVRDRRWIFQCDCL